MYVVVNPQGKFVNDITTTPKKDERGGANKKDCGQFGERKRVRGMGGILGIYRRVFFQSSTVVVGQWGSRDGVVSNCGLRRWGVGSWDEQDGSFGGMQHRHGPGYGHGHGYGIDERRKAKGGGTSTTAARCHYLTANKISKNLTKQRTARDN